MIKENIDFLKREIAEVCKTVERQPEEIHLIAVTKTVAPEYINEAIQWGVTDIGENKVQEIMDKHEGVAPVNWHMIGHLQTNKVKYIIDKVKMIHSLDRMNLAVEIHKRAVKLQRIIDVLIQVNISGEETKFGISAEDVFDFLEELQKLSAIRVKGLMTIAPFEENSENTRIHFRNLRILSKEIENRNLPNIEMKYLSMGMSNDYKIAIEEGANMIRVGTAIFGRRNY